MLFAAIKDNVSEVLQTSEQTVDWVPYVSIIIEGFTQCIVGILGLLGKFQKSIFGLKLKFWYYKRLDPKQTKFFLTLFSSCYT